MKSKNWGIKQTNICFTNLLSTKNLGSTLNEWNILLMGFNHPTKTITIKTLILTFKFEKLIFEKNLMKKGLQQKSPQK